MSAILTKSIIELPCQADTAWVKADYIPAVTDGDATEPWSTSQDHVYA
jgi:hypothetical protein